MRLSFRGVAVKKEKFGRSDAVRRSVLARSMVDPSILLNPKLKGLPCAFEARRVFLVDGAHAAKLECGLTQAAAIFRPKPKDGTIQLEIKFVKQNTAILSAPVKNIFAAVMDLSDGARPSDNNGVVNISFVIVSRSKAQVLSMLVRKSDQNVCRMLVNLPILKTQLLGTATPKGTESPSPRAQILRAIHLAGSAQNRSVSSAFASTLGPGWGSISANDALSQMPGLCRVSAVVGESEATAAAARVAGRRTPYSIARRVAVDTTSEWKP